MSLFARAYPTTANSRVGQANRPLVTCIHRLKLTAQAPLRTRQIVCADPPALKLELNIGKRWTSHTLSSYVFMNLFGQLMS